MTYCWLYCIRGSYASELLENGVHKPSGGVDVGDHPPMYVSNEDRRLNTGLHCVYTKFFFCLFFFYCITFFCHRTPMRKAEEGDLSGDTWRVYSYVTRHFLGSISPDMRYIRTTAIVKINNEIFECSGKLNLILCA